MIASLCPGLAGGLAALPATAAPAVDPTFERLAQVADPALPELSGLVASHRHPGRFWALNDSGNPAQLHALDAGGRRIGSVWVEGEANRDWEDLAAFERDGRFWLLIGDTGDNFRLRSESRLILVAEPEPGAGSVRPERVIRFRYEDGARDCEALAVDARSGTVLLAEKARAPAGLYALALDGAGALQEARRVAEFPALPAGAASPSTLPRFARHRALPTAMDLSADGRRLALLSYVSLSLFDRADGEDWASALRRPPLQLPLPAQPLFEALALAPDGRAAVIANEGLPYRVYAVPLPQSR